MHRRRPIDRRQLLVLGAAGLACVSLGWPATAQADAVDLLTLQAQRTDGALSLEFATRVALPRAVEDALQRGVPIYFVAQATLMRNRWYWRDERIARVSRTWRLAYQPLTSTWRVGLSGLNQHYPTLAEAMAAVTRIAQWRVADLSQIDADSRHYLEFSWRLDTAQLPSQMLIGLVGGSEFALGVERTLRLD
jgi:Domain of unknown function (DUF4390)